MVIGTMFGILIGGIESMMKIMIIGLIIASVAFMVLATTAIDVIVKIASRLADFSVSKQ